MDTDTVNNVIRVLIRSGQLVEACTLLEMCCSYKFGPEAHCDVNTFSLIIGGSSILQNKDILIKTFQLLNEHYDATIQPEEESFIAALNSCSFSVRRGSS